MKGNTPLVYRENMWLSLSLNKDLHLQVASRLEAIAFWLEATAIGLEAIASKKDPSFHHIQ